MSVPIQKIREIVFQMLYSLDIGKTDDEEAIKLMMKEVSVTKKTARDALQRAHDVIANKAEIDALIHQTTSAYAFDRIQTVERNILRLGVFEMLFDETIPEKVAISEAMRLARKFGTPSSASFVNALLDTIYKNSKGEKTNTTLVKESIDAMIQDEKITSEIAHEIRKQPNEG
jgi:N utilization substance protein B